MLSLFSSPVPLVPSGSSSSSPSPLVSHFGVGTPLPLSADAFDAALCIQCSYELQYGSLIRGPSR